MLNLFSPHGSNPLGNVRLSNPRNAKVDFDRSVKSNVLTMDGDLTQSKMQIPREDRPVSSLQLIHPLLCIQMMIPNNGQFLVELAVSHSSVVRMKMTCGTHISKPDVNEVKGVAHVKLPLAIPRNSWTQVVFHVPGIFSHLFGLPSVRWVDTLTIAGSVKLKRILVTSEEQLALESRPPGMLLYTLPAYGPPLWTGKCGVAQPDQKSESPQEEPVAPDPAPTKGPLETAPATHHQDPPKVQQDATTSSGDGGGFKMRFVKGANGEVSFSATSNEQEENRRLKNELEELATIKQRVQEQIDLQTRCREEEMRKIQEDRRGYVRLMESPTPTASTSRFGLPLKRKTEGGAPTGSSGHDDLPTGWDSDEESPFAGGGNPLQSGAENKEKKLPFMRYGPPTDTRKPRVPKQSGGGTAGLVSPSKAQALDKMKHTSLIQLNLEEPGAVHPSDTYLPPRGGEKQAVGFGVGCMDVIASGEGSTTSTPPPAGTPSARRIERIHVHDGSRDDEE